MIGFAIGAFGAILALFGIFAFLVALASSFRNGNNNDLTGLIMGGALFIAGIGFIFYGGYLL